ncbi:MAG: zinc-dependent metalloprotease, partial [Phycisphaerae bacterium]
KKLPDRLLGEVLREIVTHEVGHTLGLRHNFKASTWLSLEEMKRRRDHTDEPTASSVMDYNAVLYMPGDDPAELRHLVTPCIGPYDYWAIEYGYKAPGKDDGNEKAMLAKIASRCTQRELAYATDEDTMGLTSPDPDSNRYDVGDDPLAWARLRAELCDDLLKDIKKWAIKGDEPNQYLRTTFEIVMREKAYNLFYAARMVTGQHFNRNRAGDPDAKPVFQLLDPARQREVVKTLAATVFNDDYFKIDAGLLNDLGPSRWSDWASPMLLRVDYPIHQVVGTLQSYSLLALCTPQGLQRVYDAELKSTAEDKFTAAELILSVRKAIWGNLEAPGEKKYSDTEPMISSIRRNLQAQHLRLLLATADATPGALTSPDLQNMVRFALRDLSQQIGALLAATKRGDGSRLDFATRAHLTECKSQIDRVLDAPQVKMAGGGIIILGNSPQSGDPRSQSRN